MSSRYWVAELKRDGPLRLDTGTGMAFAVTVHFLWLLWLKTWSNFNSVWKWNPKYGICQVSPTKQEPDKRSKFGFLVPFVGIISSQDFATKLSSTILSPDLQPRAFILLLLHTGLCVTLYISPQCSFTHSFFHLFAHLTALSWALHICRTLCWVLCMIWWCVRCCLVFDKLGKQMRKEKAICIYHDVNKPII